VVCLLKDNVGNVHLLKAAWDALFFTKGPLVMEEKELHKEACVQMLLLIGTWVLWWCLYPTLSSM